MNWSGEDYQFMSRALQLARRGLYSTHPNPRVGCVLVKNGKLLAEGWHQQCGGAHAEVHALNIAGKEAQGADCYLSLEPCTHTGKTPPCVDALISAGIRRVVIAGIDPNPRVSGKGVVSLQKAGIITETGLLEQQAHALNPGFEMRMLHGRPFVRCKLAMSLDGHTALADGQSKWITGTAARADVQKLRAQSSAIMTGINTVLADNPGLNVRDIDTMGRQPVRIVLDRRLRIPKDTKLLGLPGESIIFTVYGCPDREQSLIASGISVIRIDGSGEKDFLMGVMRYLANEKEINEVLVECGPTLTGSLLQAGLIDELIIYTAPLLLGHEARNLFNIPGIKSIADGVGLEFTDVRMIGRDMKITLKILKDF